MSIPAPASIKHILVFTLDEPRYALDLSVVERVIRAVELTALPDSPPMVLGAINVHGQITPVVDLRRHLGLPPQALNPDRRLILARTESQRVALLVDNVAGIHDLAEGEWVAADDLLPGALYIHSMAKVGTDLVLICDLDQLLSLQERIDLAQVLAQEGLDALPRSHPVGQAA
jgi:purine-binding chemotaxis protein CheW